MKNTIGVLRLILGIFIGVIGTIGAIMLHAWNICGHDERVFNDYTDSAARLYKMYKTRAKD